MSTFGNTVSAFSNFLTLTRDNKLRKADTILNDVARNSYSMGQLLVGKGVGEVVRGGKFITERIRLTSAGNFGPYTPGQTRNPSRGSTIQTLNMPWRFYENNHPFTDAEVELNAGDDFASYSSFKTSVKQELELDHYEGLEDTLWALPNAADMETGSTGTGTAVPGAAYSIPALITEDGSVPIGTGTFTTIHGLSPTTYTNWKNHVSTYGTDLADNATGLFAAFDQMLSKLDFQPPPGSKFFEKSSAGQDVVCFTNTDGQNTFSRLLRGMNDQSRAGPQDPSYGMPQFKGIPIQRISALDTALLEQNPIGTLTTAVYPAGRPRFFFVNKKYLFPVFHGKHFMEETPPINGGVTQRDTDTLFKVSWFNTICRSRKRHGIIRPAA